MEAAHRGIYEDVKREDCKKEKEEMSDKIYTVEIDCPLPPMDEFRKFNMDSFNPLRDFMGVDNYDKLSEKEKEKGREMTLRVKY